MVISATSSSVEWKPMSQNGSDNIRGLSTHASVVNRGPKNALVTAVSEPHAAAMATLVITAVIIDFSVPMNLLATLSEIAMICTRTSNKLAAMQQEKREFAEQDQAKEQVGERAMKGGEEAKEYAPDQRSSEAEQLSPTAIEKVAQSKEEAAEGAGRKGAETEKARQPSVVMPIVRKRAAGPPLKGVQGIGNKSGPAGAFGVGVASHMQTATYRTYFPINSTVFYKPITPGKRSKSAFFFHHGHSNCVCPREPGDPPIVAAKCKPGCNSSMPSHQQPVDEYSWWDLYNVSSFFHSLGHDVFVFSMPLKGINLGPGSTDKALNSDHWWFLQWEKKGDHPLRYFLEPVVLTANYAQSLGYDAIYMAGLSGGGWSTTFAPAIEKRIKASFPIAGSTPCAMRNPDGLMPNQTWTGSDAEDFEQNCSPNPNPANPAHPGRRAFQACNYTCQYLLAGLEPGRFQVQILHEYDSCCFSPHGRHDQMKRYERNIRAELSQRGEGKHGWFTTTADNHVKHEVCAQDKTIIAAAMAGAFAPGGSRWEQLPCDIIHGPVDQPGRCAPDIEPGFPPHVPATRPGFRFLGHGACRDAAGKAGKYQRWGSRSGGNFDDVACAKLCADAPECDAYMSTDWNATRAYTNGYCQFYCTDATKGGLCNTAGNGGGVPTTSDNSSPLRACWLKTK
eukprot:g801.t1